MHWIDALAEHIEGLAIPDVPALVYVQNIPSDVDEAIMIAGPPSGVDVDPELPRFLKGGFQMVVRAKTSSRAEVIAQTVSDAVETYETVPGTIIEIRHIIPRHLPISFPRSDGDYFEAVVNFDLCFIRL